MLHSQLVNKADAACFLPENGHLIGVGQIREGYVMTDKIPTESKHMSVSLKKVMHFLNKKILVQT